MRITLRISREEIKKLMNPDNTITLKNLHLSGYEEEAIEVNSRHHGKFGIPSGEVTLFLDDYGMLEYEIVERDRSGDS